MSTQARKFTENREKDTEENLWAQEKTRNQKGDKKPKSGNKNQETKIKRAHGENEQRETKQESL